VNIRMMALVPDPKGLVLNLDHLMVPAKAMAVPGDTRVVAVSPKDTREMVRTPRDTRDLVVVLEMEAERDLAKHLDRMMDMACLPRMMDTVDTLAVEMEATELLRVTKEAAAVLDRKDIRVLGPNLDLSLAPNLDRMMDPAEMDRTLKDTRALVPVTEVVARVIKAVVVWTDPLVIARVADEVMEADLVTIITMVMIQVTMMASGW